MISEVRLYCRTLVRRKREDVAEATAGVDDCLTSFFWGGDAGAGDDLGCSNGGDVGTGTGEGSGLILVRISLE